MELLNREQALEQLKVFFPKWKFCAICNQQVSHLTKSHLTKHESLLQQESIQGETLRETYIRLFGDPDPFRILAAKLISLYHPNREKWITQDRVHFPEFARWREVNPQNACKDEKWLRIHEVIDHLRFNRTVGIFAGGKDLSHVLVWDIDSPHIGTALSVVKSMTNTLHLYNLTPHVSASGKKGFHVTIFIDKPMPISIRHRLFDALMATPNVQSSMAGEVNVEFRPTRGTAIKLPLGIHFGADRFCSFVDSWTLEPLKNPYDYLLTITPDPIVKVNEALLSLKATTQKRLLPAERKRREEKRTVAYLQGIDTPGTRHHRSVDAVLSILRYHQPRSSQELFELATEWLNEQYRVNKANIRSSRFEAEKELSSIVHWSWYNARHFSKMPVVLILGRHAHWILHNVVDLSGQVTLLAFLVRHLCSKEEDFELGFTHLKNVTGFTDRTLSKQLHRLRQDDLIRITKEYSHQNNPAMSKVRRYQLVGLPASSPATDMTFTSIDDSEELFSVWCTILRKLLTPSELKLRYPTTYHHILNDNNSIMAS